MDVEVIEGPNEDFPPPWDATARVRLDKVPLLVTVTIHQGVEEETGLSRPWEVRSLAVEHTSGEAITSTLLRSVPVAEVLSAVVDEASPPGFVLYGSGVPHDDLPAAGKRGPVDETLRLVGLVYDNARLQGGNPVQEVAQKFEISRSTATRWVRRATDRGHVQHMARGSLAGQ